MGAPGDKKDEIRKKSKLVHGNNVIFEIEKKVAENYVGTIIGVNAMMNPNTEVRALSVMAKTDCIFILLNEEVFKLLLSDKLKRDKESIAHFCF